MCRLYGRHDSVFYFHVPICQHGKTTPSLPVFNNVIHIGQEHVDACVTSLAPDSRHIVAF
jgi:hypothetical protein